MKKIICVMVLLNTTLGFGQDSLKKLMADMGDKMKFVATNLENSAVKDQVVADCEDIRIDAVSATQIVPDSVAAIADAPQRDKIMAQYKDELLQIEKKVLELKQNIQDGKSAEAQKNLQEISSLKKQGHTDFRS